MKTIQLCLLGLSAMMFVYSLYQGNFKIMILSYLPILIVIASNSTVTIRKDSSHKIQSAQVKWVGILDK